jgi:hypothetical protein
MLTACRKAQIEASLEETCNENKDGVGEERKASDVAVSDD